MENNTLMMSDVYTFEELHNGALDKIPKTSGVYFVIIPEHFKIVIKEETDGYKLTSKGNPSSYPVEQYVVYVFISLLSCDKKVVNSIHFSVPVYE